MRSSLKNLKHWVTLINKVDKFMEICRIRSPNNNKVGGDINEENFINFYKYYFD